MVFSLAESLGGVESLIEVPQAMTHQSVEGSAAAVPADLVRLSCGIEAAADLVEDLRQALAALLFLGDFFAARGGRDVLPWALGSLLLFPTAFFLAAFYTESLFLATTAGSLWCARSRRPCWPSGSGLWSPVARP